MTACTNNGGSRARRAVTAALVGVLSVGAAPMVALATGAAPASGDVTTMSVSPKSAWENGKVTYAYDNDGYVITDPEGYEFEYDGREHHILPQLVMPEGATNPVAVDDSKVYFTDADGDPVAKELIENVGTYHVVIPANAIMDSDANYEGNLVMEFSIVGKSLEGATIYEGDDVTDSSFTYTGEALDFGFAVDGVRYGADGRSLSGLHAQAFEVIWVDAATGAVLPAAPQNAGSYQAVLRGTGDYAGSKETIDFTIAQLDLSSADIFIPDVSQWGESWTGLPDEAYVNGVMMGNDKIAINWPDGESGNIMEHNTYEVAVSPAEGNENITGLGTASFRTVDTVVDANQIMYGTDVLDGKELEVVRTKTNSYFDFAKISCLVPGAYDHADITITDADGNEVAPQDVNSKAGTYTLVFDFVDDYAFGLKEPVSMTIKVMEDDLWTAADLTYTWNGDVVAGTIHPTYDGEDVLPEIGIDVKSHDKTLVQGEDYDVVVKNSLDQEVDQIVDAGTYTVTVVSDTYDIRVSHGDWSGTTLRVDVQPMQLDNLKIGSEQMADFGDKGSYIPYTGEDASYYFYYTDDKGNEVRLPEGVVEVDHFFYDADFTDLSLIGTWWGDWKSAGWEDVDSINAVGQYVPSVKIVNDNYLWVPDITGTVVDHNWFRDFSVAKIDVRSERVFTDVSDTDWFAQEVFQANEQGYIGGVGGTTMFAPLSNLTRADMACVLYRMAGGEINTDQEGMTNEELGYISSFSDVDQNAYYAKAVAWATKMGITRGYGDTFGSARYITTEEFVTMLARYAAICGTDTSVDTDEVLSGVADGDQVSSYARDAVAWAVSEGYIAKDGNLIDPQGTVYRARAVVIAVRYQPEQLSGDDVLVDNPGLTDQDANRDN
ncbi:S-layer homology domain-containing protein [Thermophilibacter mediterraneus]|uniref:S-layer homology domain-containing protein n=1 Tax=Thermophilibacter mediterraneus TaxID=1871031 RepID=UPI0009307BA2|nr:S-layer homology domain-containing protein [Thermophilibacter mediterraneus]